MFNGNSPFNDTWLCLCKEPCSLFYLFTRYPGDLFHFFRRILLNALCELLKAYSPFFYEFLVINSFVNDDMYHAQGEGIIRTRSDLKPEVRLFCQFGPARVNDNELCSLFKTFLDPELYFPICAGNDRVVTPYQYAPGIDLSVIITDRQIAVCHTTHIHPWMETLCRTRFTPVGCSNGMGEPDEMSVMVSSRPLAQNDGLRAVLFLDFINFVCDGIQGFIPGDPFPLPLTPFSGPF